MRTLGCVILAGLLGASGCSKSEQALREDERAPVAMPRPEPARAEVAAKTADRDADGIPDPDDACPDAPEDKDGFQDTDGCPDPDNDQDGIADAQDRCPASPENRNGFEDGDGCPDTPPGKPIVVAQPDTGQANVDLLAALAGEGPRLDSRNQPTSIRAIKARPLGDLPPQPPPAGEPPPRPVASGPAPVVAVFDIQDASRKLADAAARDQLSEYLAAQLTELAGYRVVPRDQLRARLLAQKSSSYQQCYDQSCQLELGKAMAAEKSLSTKLLQVGRRCAITATLYDLRSETTDAATTVDAKSCKLEDLMTGLQDVARRLAGSR